MELIIILCLFIVIALLLQDKIIIIKHTKQKEPGENAAAKSRDIMGKARVVERNTMPIPSAERRISNQQNDRSSFNAESPKEQDRIIPQEELDDVFSEEPNLEEEEEEWSRHGEPNGEDGFATGVTFEELNTVGSLLQQEVLEPSFQKQAVDIVRKIQGTELFSLLENSVKDASQKISRLLDQRIDSKTDFSSSTLRNKGFEEFDIGEFV